MSVDLPLVILENELIKILRLTELGVKNPKRTLKHYRDKGTLKPTQLSGYNVYTRESINDFLKAQTKGKENEQ